MRPLYGVGYFVPSVPFSARPDQVSLSTINARTRSRYWFICLESTRTLSNCEILLNQSSLFFGIFSPGFYGARRDWVFEEAGSLPKVPVPSGA